MTSLRRICCTTLMSLQNQILSKNQGLSLLQKNLSICSHICNQQRVSIHSSNVQKPSINTATTKSINVLSSRNPTHSVNLLANPCICQILRTSMPLINRPFSFDLIDKKQKLSENQTKQKLQQIHRMHIGHIGATESVNYRVYTVSSLASTLWEHLNSKKLKHRKYILRRSALRLYLCCVELIDHDEFMREFNLPDTLTSWFRISELHIWMCMVRLSQEGNEGVILRNFVMEYFWQDLDKKSKKLGGLLSDDKTLAGAVWRNLFHKSCTEAQHLETVVEYIRKQVVHLDRMDSGVIQTAGLVTFLPLRDTPAAAERSKHVLMQIAKRV